MKRFLVFSMVVTMVLVMFVGSAMAADTKTPQVTAPKTPQKHVMTIRGEVQATKDEKGNITAVHVVNGKSTKYSVTLNEKGKELGTTMAGKIVQATGMIDMKDGQKWFTVEKYSEAPKRTEAPQLPKAPK